LVISNSSSKFKLAFALFTALILTLLSSPDRKRISIGQASSQGQSRLVLAFYYSWYDPGSFGPGRTRFQPAAPYFSTDPAVIQRHVGEAKSAGIDGFVQSWLGPSQNQTESNFQTLLNIASAGGFKAAVDFESGSPFFATHQDRISALSTLLNTHANHPAYLRVDGKPVVFFWANWLFSVSEWAEIRNQVDPNHNSIWIAEGGNTEYLSVFDGLHLYNIAWSANPAGTAATWAANTRSAAATYGAFKYWVATAMPGFDDSLLGRGNSTVVRDRAGGTFYQNSFSGAASSAPDMLIITSFNEWAEGSNIEPSVEFGGFYLDLTSQLSSGFKSGNIAPPPAIPTPTEGPSPTPLPTATIGPSPTATISPTPTDPPLPTSSPTPVASPTAGVNGQIQYVVEPGDSLSAISARFSVQIDELYELNQLTPESIITVGQTLILGVANSITEQPTSAEFPGTNLRADGSIIYIIQEADTLIGIADKFGLTLEELYELNDDLDQTSILLLGKQIIVGKRTEPLDVGGSTDLASPVAAHVDTPSPTETREATPTASATAIVPTSEPVQVAALTSVDPTESASDSNQLNKVLPLFIGAVLLLATTGGLFLYLGRDQ
jgi:LysM repeat protein